MDDDPDRSVEVTRPESSAAAVPGEPLATAERALTAQRKLRELLGATRRVTEDLDLDHVLARVVQTAMSLVDASFGALGVLGEDRRFERFIHWGMSDEQAAQIGDLPEGRGLLGAVIESGETIHLSRIDADSRSVGFPPHHPAMASFLGVPIRVRDEVYGNLYLTDHRAGEFSDEDRSLVEALAVTAGVAIDNARTYEEARCHERLSLAISELTADLLSPVATEPLGAVAERFVPLLPAEVVTIVVPTDAHHVRIEVARGRGAAGLEGTTLPAAGVLATKVLETGALATGAFADPGPDAARRPGVPGLAATAATPLVASGHAVGALCVSRGPGEPAFTRRELATIAEFATRAGLAVSLAWARRDRQRLDVMELRSRIARDLHDNVIQRIFAVGLGLQSLAAAEPERAETLERHISELDGVISEIRTAVFALRAKPPTRGTMQLRHRVLDATAELTPALRATPKVAFTGPVDLLARGSLADDIVAVVRESLANVARHADATTTRVSIKASDRGVSVVIDDDGTGVHESAERTGGTANLAARAAANGGTYALEARPGRGTRVRWSVPFPDD